ncbi:dihydrofolate reductase family protein [Rhodococcus erythropolis]|uniref:dihydrofolate reductase family protein n=1 Tax=Rhodococcus erythropolis TaxID=1833 RepID=UPI001E500D35|nr:MULTISPECIES: dihydrofolate reductase family protein [Rhodococcus erythropolis group]MCD2104691.1 dihydrofolate reductase family protein [Rhodococcus qingshengii]MCZ4525183.1 dihydrofolate reductase family protein [Rhodococcus erythropolis]
MVRLIYSAICSIDGYIADSDGNFDWAVPGAQVHSFVNELERGVGTYLLGRRMYETMIPWETMAHETTPHEDPGGTSVSGYSVPGGPSVPDEFAGIEAATVEFARIWRGIDKIVYSTTLNEVSTARTRIVPRFDADFVSSIKSGAVQDISIGGPTVAVSAFAAGLVDEVRLFLCPVNIGGGLRALPEERLDLQLLEEKTFDGGVIYLRYAVR